MIATQIQAAVNFCFVDCNESFEGKKKATIACLDMFDRWRREKDLAYITQCRTDPNFDMSPAAFSRAYNQGFYQTA